MKEYIARKLNAMHSLEDKKILKDLLDNLLVEMYRTSEEKYAQLEKRVREELPMLSEQYSIYTTIMERERIDATHSYLRPMIEQDLQTPGIKLKEALAEPMRPARNYLFTIFYQADYLQCKALADSSRLFPGVIKTSRGEVSAKFHLKPAQRYIDCLENLYQLFYANNVPWLTVNAPYLSKFFDVFLLDAEQDITDAVQAITVSFGPYEKSILYDIIPVWNIEKHRVKGDGFPMPVLDTLNYEHRFDISELGTEHGYLIDYHSNHIISTRREGSEIIAVSPVGEIMKWGLWAIIKPRETITESYTYPVMSNKQKDTFAGRMIAHYGTVVKTKGELSRVLNSFDAIEYMEFDSLHLSEGNVPGETYSMDPFIKDEIRDMDSKKTLILRFKPPKYEHYLNRDVMSFLVSQVQCLYPEYNCVGVLI